MSATGERTVRAACPHDRNAPDTCAMLVTVENANAVTSSELTDMGGGPVFYDCLVEVERA